MQIELDRRVNLLGKTKASPQLQTLEIEFCKRDILYWFQNYTYTDKNLTFYSKEDPSEVPFIPYPFQVEVITEIWDCIVEWKDVFIEKSRQMWLSWIIMAILVYGMIFHNHKYHVISQKEEYVDKPWDMKSLFEKARFMIRNMPNRMLPPWLSKTIGTEYNKYMVIGRKDGTGAITWESANPNASRSGTYNAIFLDEFAFQSNANSINGAAASATPCRIFNSTPNGEWNEFYRMRKLAMPTRDKMWNTIPPVIKWLRYHRSDHPNYTKERYQNKIKGMDQQKIAQELEINYNVALTGRVYTDFPSEATDVKYDPMKPLYVSIDNSHWGADPHALILAQLEDNYINVIDTLEINCSVTDIAELCVTQPKIMLNDAQLNFLQRYKKYNRQRAVFIGDPYDTHSTLNQSTIFEEYRKVNIYLNTPNERDKKEQIMKARANIYRVRYNENCLDFASALMNARYPERPENNSSTAPNEKPIHDRTSHYRSSLEYLIVYLLENPVAKKIRVVEDTRPKRDYTTWQLIYPRVIDTRVKRNYTTWELITPWL